MRENLWCGGFSGFVLVFVFCFVVVLDCLKLNWLAVYFVRSWRDVRLKWGVCAGNKRALSLILQL